MSDFGPPQQPGTSAFGNASAIQYNAFAPPPPPARSSRAFLLALLLIACILLGGVVAWGLRERAHRTRLTARNRNVEDAYTFVLAKRNDLANFLTDPRTRLIRLEGHGEARGRALTVAWQDESRCGVVVGDSMPLPPDDSGYIVWLLPQAPAAAPVRCDARVGGSTLFRPEPGVTSFEFRARDFDGKVRGFIVTQEQRKDARSPGGQVVYQSADDERA